MLSTVLLVALAYAGLLALSFVLAFPGGFVLMTAWNLSVAEIFGWPQVTFWQAYWLTFLLSFVKTATPTTFERVGK